MAHSRQGLEGKYRDVPVLQKPYHAEPLEHLLVRLLTGEMQLREGGWDLPPPCQYPDAPADGSRFLADQGR